MEERYSKTQSRRYTACLTSKNWNNTYVHPGDRFFDFYTLHYNNFFPTVRTVKINILLLYNLGIDWAYYQVNWLSRYWDLIISARLIFWSRVKIHGPSCVTRELSAKHYLFTLHCLLIWLAMLSSTTFRVRKNFELMPS